MVGIAIAMIRPASVNPSLDKVHWPTVTESFPFPHVVKDGFLPTELFACLRSRLDDLLRLGLSETQDLMKLSKMPGYDCYCWVFPPDTAASLDFFIRRSFQQLMAELFGLELSGEVSCQFNWHPPGARNGTWHTDYVVSYHTEESRSPDGVNVWHYGCNLLGNNADLPGRTIIRRTRALAYLYYLGAETADQPVDGGQTAIGYQSPLSDEIALFRAVEPVPNRLLAFECSPMSLHRMLGVSLSGRGLLVGWLHAEPEIARRRHGIAPEFWNEAAVRGQFDFNEPAACTELNNQQSTIN
jgi:hypothetical protein